MGSKANQNPFVDDSIVRNNDYCPCTKVEAQLLARIQNGHNVVLVGRRRVGKSSVAHHIVDGLEKKYKLEADFYHITTEADLAHTLVKACQKMMLKIKASKRVLEFIKSIQLQWDINTSTLSVGLNQRTTPPPQLSSAMDVLEQSLTQARSQVVILFDEFQQITKLKNSTRILKYMRGRIQKLHRVSVLYVGSLRHEMDHIFRSPQSPFYKQAEVVYFDSIEKEDFFKFVAQKFSTKKIKLDPAAFNKIYDLCYGVTGDMQSFFKTAFDVLEPNMSLGLENCSLVLDAIYKNEKKYFIDIIEGPHFTKVQKKMLCYLALQHPSAAGLFSQNTQKKLGVKSPGAVQNALKSLQTKGALYMFLGAPYFSNPYFKLWLITKQNKQHKAFVEPSLW